MKNIKACDLKPEYNIIDLRTKGAYMKGHIYNSKNIDMNNLADMPNMYLDKDKHITYIVQKDLKVKGAVNFLK